MPNLLSSLSIDEISLVDAPANAETDPVTGRKIARARVALFKRDKPPKKTQRDKDDPGTQDIDPPLRAVSSAPNYLLTGPDGEAANQFTGNRGADHIKSKKEKPMKMKKLKAVLKAGDTLSRAAIVACVERQAVKVAKKYNVSVEHAASSLWELNPEAQLAYEKAGLPIYKASTPFFRATKAECELDDRARKLMKRSPGLSYAKACTSILESDPGLYRKYETEVANGELYDVPDRLSTNTSYPDPLIGSYSSQNVDRMLNKSDDDDDDDEDKSDDECDSCGEDVDDEDSFCSNCGADLGDEAKRKRKRKKQGGPPALIFPRMEAGITG